MSMNLYRLAGDLLHIASIFVFACIVGVKKNAAGVSLKSQELYLLVFVTRYLDLITSFYSVYNSLMKCFYVFSTAGIILVLRFVEPTKSTYNASQDSVRHWTAFAGPAFVVALLAYLLNGASLDIIDDEVEVHFQKRNINLLELLWYFSIILESVAMVPQLQMERKHRAIAQVELKRAIAMMGSYRFFYCINWIYRSFTEKNYIHHWFVYLAGILQVILYSEFYNHYGRELLHNCTACTCLRSPQPVLSLLTPPPEETGPMAELNVPLIAETSNNDETTHNAEEDVPQIQVV